MQALEALIEQSGLSDQRQYLSKADALARFREDFPDLAGATERLERNPLPASIEVRLGPEARTATTAVDDLAAALGSAPGVADVRYDRRWLSRLGSAVRFVRTVGLWSSSALLAVAAALTVANVVRLAAYARRDEIEIMQLVGAPFAFIRGPFVAEGILQGGVGALRRDRAALGHFPARERPGTGSLALEGLGLDDAVHFCRSARC